MKVIETNELKKYIYEQFSEESSDLVFNFYKNYLILSANETDEKAKAGFNRKKYIKPNIRRMMHVSNLVDTYDKDSIISAIKVFKDKCDHGEIGNPTMSYFAGFVKNEFNKPKKQKSNIIKTNSEEIIIKNNITKNEIVPINPIFIKKTNRGDVIYDYDFHCTCGSLVDADMSNCADCGSLLLWGKFNREDLKIS